MKQIPIYLLRRYKQIKDSNPTDMDYDSFNYEYNSFYINCKEIIQNFENNKINIEKENYLDNPNFTLHIVKNRNTFDSIIAQVKWKYQFENKVKKLKYHTVFIGTTKQLGSDIDTPVLNSIAKERIKEYFNDKSLPLPVDVKMLNDYAGLTECFETIKNKKDEIMARLNPEFYISKITNKSSYKSIVANIKWGFPYPDRNGSPRYISFYIGSEKEFVEDIKTEKFKQLIKPKVIDYLRVNSYF